MCIPGRPEAPLDGTMSLLHASASVTLALRIIALRVIESHSVHKAADCSRKHELHAAGFCHQLQPPASLDHPASASFTRWTNVPALHIVQVTCLHMHIIAHEHACTVHSVHAHALPAHCPCSNRKTCLLWTDLLQEITSRLHLIYVDHCWWQ